MKGVKEPIRSRDTIVTSAVKVVRRKGYGAAGVSEILSGTDLTRGALYYHFPGKEALGHAVLDVIEADLRSMWLLPLENQSDPVAALQKVLGSACAQLTDDEVSLGCPLNNLAQELCCTDEGFRIRIAEIYDLWIDGVAELLRRGQELRKISRSVDPRVAAAFLVGGWTGARGIAKVTKDSSVLAGCADQLIRYIESLTEIYDIIRVINGHAEAERWFAVMAVARDSHDLLWSHLDQLNSVARRAVESFHIGHRRQEQVDATTSSGHADIRGTERPGNPYRELQ